MRFFPDNIRSEVQARLNYKRLAVLYHPDMGGNEEVMREINQEYELVKKQLQKYRKGLGDLKIGDRVLVNGTECTVTAVFEKTFIAKARGRHRLAVFEKKTGCSVYDKKYIARLPE